MDKLRAVLRRPDRDHLETLAPHIQVLGPRGQPADSATYQQLITAIAARRVVRLHYQAGDTDAVTVAGPKMPSTSSCPTYRDLTFRPRCCPPVHLLT